MVTKFKQQRAEAHKKDSFFKACCEQINRDFYADESKREDAAKAIEIIKGLYNL